MYSHYIFYLRLSFVYLLLGTFALQKAIYSVQIALEDVQKATYPDRMFLCDRGSCDGAAYWPEGPEDFFKQMGTTEEEVSDSPLKRN